MKSKLTSILFILLLAVMGQQAFVSTSTVDAQQPPPPMTKATPPHGNMNDDIQNGTNQCLKEARRDYRKCLRRGGNRARCRRRYKERMSACSG